MTAETLRIAVGANSTDLMRKAMACLPPPWFTVGFAVTASVLGSVLWGRRLPFRSLRRQTDTRHCMEPSSRFLHHAKVPRKTRGSNLPGTSFRTFNSRHARGHRNRPHESTATSSSHAAGDGHPPAGFAPQNIGLSRTECSPAPRPSGSPEHLNRYSPVINTPPVRDG